MRLLGTLAALILDAQRNPRQEPERVLLSAAAVKQLRAEATSAEPVSIALARIDGKVDPDECDTYAGVPIFKDDRIAPALFRFVWRERAATA